MAITCCFSIFGFVKFLKFLNSSSDLVHIMKILSMNCKKRMDLSLIRELMHFFSNFDMNILACAGAKTFFMTLPFWVEVTVNDRITDWGACLNFPP